MCRGCRAPARAPPALVASCALATPLTNERRTGYLEICKEADRSGVFTFTVNPGNLGPFVVPSGACTPAIEVPGGRIEIQEQVSSGFVMTSACATLPGDRQLSCRPLTQTSTVAIAEGGISTQTIAFIQNRGFGAGAGPASAAPAFQLAIAADGARDGPSFTSLHCMPYAHP